MDLLFDHPISLPLVYDFLSHSERSIKDLPDGKNNGRSILMDAKQKFLLFSLRLLAANGCRGKDGTFH
jgi:hypothetical protein